MALHVSVNLALMDQTVEMVNLARFDLLYSLLLWTISYTDVKECDSNPCLNGGNCTEEIGRFTCVCQGEWKGQICSSR
jgi:hypothetical protein